MHKGRRIWADRKTDSSRRGAQPSDPSLRRCQQRGRAQSRWVCPAGQAPGFRTRPSRRSLPLSRSPATTGAAEPALINAPSSGTALAGRCRGLGGARASDGFPPRAKTCVVKGESSKLRARPRGELLRKGECTEMAPECACNRVYASLGHREFHPFGDFLGPTGSTCCQGREVGGHAQVKSHFWHLLGPPLRRSSVFNPKLV